MKLVTKDILTKLKKQDPYDPSGPGRELKDTEAKVWLKIFTPDANWTWYAISASEDPDTGDIQFFGLVNGQEKEFGYFWLSDLKRVRGRFNLPVERDLYWNAITLAELKIKEGLS